MPDTLANAGNSNFNPRSREGSDTRFPRCKRFLGYFNPRSREGSDSHAVHSTLLIMHFNPRSREGSDLPLAVMV